MNHNIDSLHVKVTVLVPLRAFLEETIYDVEEIPGQSIALVSILNEIRIISLTFENLDCPRAPSRLLHRSSATHFHTIFNLKYLKHSERMKLKVKRL